MTDLPDTPRLTPTRYRELASHDRERFRETLASHVVAHVGFVRDGAPIGMKYLDVVPTVDFYNFIMDASPRKNAAACFIAWFVSEEGQATQLAVEFKTNDTIPPAAPAGAVFVAIDTEEEAQLVRSVGEQLQAILTD
jgi:hypothetical protein